MRKCNASFYITYYITRDLFYTEAFTLEPRSSVKWFISCNQHYRNKRTLNTSYLWSPGTLMGCLDVSPLAPASGLRSTSTVVNFCSSSWYRAFSSRRTLCQDEHVLIYTFLIQTYTLSRWTCTDLHISHPDAHSVKVNMYWFTHFSSRRTLCQGEHVLI